MDRSRSMGWNVSCTGLGVSELKKSDGVQSLGLSADDGIMSAIDFRCNICDIVSLAVPLYKLSSPEHDFV